MILKNLHLKSKETSTGWYLEYLGQLIFVDFGIKELEIQNEELFWNDGLQMEPSITELSVDIIDCYYTDDEFSNLGAVSFADCCIIEMFIKEKS